MGARAHPGKMTKRDDLEGILLICWFFVVIAEVTLIAIIDMVRVSSLKER
jgi:hypothetical protein